MAANRKRTSYITNDQDNSINEGGKDNLFDRIQMEQMDKCPKGFQILREYVYYYGYDFAKICRNNFDNSERGIISKDQFRTILTAYKDEFFLTSENIEDVFSGTVPVHNNEGTELFINYSSLQEKMLAIQPKTKYSIAYLYGVKKGKPDDFQVENWEREIENQKRNIWDQKEKGQEWNFKFGDLNRLEESIMQSKRDENGDIIDEDDDNDEDMKRKNRNLELTENEIYEQSIKKLYIMNNETILKNFDIRVAQFMAKIIKPSSDVQLTDKKLAELFENYFKTEKYSSRLDQIKHYFLDDFEKIMNDYFKEIRLTEDEIKLLHYRIWEDNNFGQLTYLNISKWVIKNRHLKPRELRTIGLSEQDQRRILNKEETTSPKLFKELVKYAYSFGLNFLESSLKPIIDTANYIVLRIQFEQQDIDDLKFYLANHGTIHLQEAANSGFLSATMYLDTKKLIDLITREAQKIAMHTIDFKVTGNKSKEQTRRSVQSKIVQGVVNKLTLKLRIYTDENDLIEEIKLRKVVADSFGEIDQSDLDIIFTKLQNVTEPSKYVSQRKIYLPEFLDFLLGGPLFDDVLFQKINDYEKQQKIRDLGIQGRSAMSLDGRQDTEGHKQNAASYKNQSQQRNLVLDYETLQEQQMYTNETERSQLPGQFQFKQGNQSQNHLLQSPDGNITNTQENEEEQKKFQIITKEFIQQQIIQQKKAQQDSKKIKTVSDGSKQGAGADNSFSRMQDSKETNNRLIQQVEDDNSWTPDYRKIAIEELLKKEKPKAGKDYIKGGFIYEDSDDAFVTKPIDDRQVVCKLYEYLKKKVLVGPKSNLKDYDAVDFVVLSFKNKLQAIDPTLRGVITVQQFYSFIKLNFPDFTQQEVYQLKTMAESYAGSSSAPNEYERTISYTYFCMNLHKFICQNILYGKPSQ